MTANTATPIEPKYFVTFDDRTYQITPHKEADLPEDYDRYTTYIMLDDFVQQYFVPNADFIQRTLRFRAILAVAYATAEASAGLNYGLLPSHSEYLATVKLFNEGLGNREIKLRNKNTRPETTSSSSDLSDSASTADIVKAINELRSSLNGAPTSSRKSGLVARVTNWLKAERPSGAHS